MKKAQAVGFFLVLVWLATGIAQDDPFVGYFSGELDGMHYQATIERINSTSYDGLMWIDGEKMQLDARRYGEQVSGMLRSQTGELRFRAQLRGSALNVETEDGRRVILWRSNGQ